MKFIASKKRFIVAMLLSLMVAVVGGLVYADDQAAPPAPAAAAATAAPAAPALQPDPSGANTGGAADIVGASAGAPTADDLKNLGPKEPLAMKVADAVGHNRISINIVWTLVAGFLVMFMQAGFAMVETGFTQAKNAGHTMAMNFMVYPLGMLGYWICGFALQMGGVGGVASLSGGTALLSNEFTIHLFGKDFGLWGTTGFFLSGISYDASIFALFLFQMVFMDTTATIPTGSMAERWNFKSFVIYASSSAASSTRCMQTGYGAADGFHSSGRTSASATVMSTMQVHRLCIWSVVFVLWQGRW